MSTNNSNDPTVGEDDEAAGVPPAYNRFVSIAGPNDVVDPPKGAQRTAPKSDDSDDYTLGLPTAKGGSASSSRPSLDDLWNKDATNSNPPATSKRPSLDDVWNSDKTGTRGEDDDAAGYTVGPARAASGKAAPPVSTTSDVAKSGASGFRSGVEGLLGLPGDIDAGGQWLVSHALQKIGLTNSADDAARALQTARAGGAGFNLPTGQYIHSTANAAGVPDYTPQTTAGRYAKTVGEFVPGALTMPEAEFPAIAGNLAKYAVAPGVASELGGQMTEGTKAEPYIRAAAGLAGGLGAEGVAQAARAGACDRQISQSAHVAAVDSGSDNAAERART